LSLKLDCLCVKFIRKSSKKCFLRICVQFHVFQGRFVIHTLPWVTWLSGTVTARGDWSLRVVRSNPAGVQGEKTNGVQKARLTLAPHSAQQPFNFTHVRMYVCMCSSTRSPCTDTKQKQTDSEWVGTPLDDYEPRLLKASTVTPLTFWNNCQKCFRSFSFEKKRREKVFLVVFHLPQVLAVLCTRAIAIETNTKLLQSST
jgi:hypothetical protein